MKTEDLVALLAAGNAPVPANAVAQRFAQALCVGVVAALMLLVLTLGVRADLSLAATDAMFWIKALFALCLALAAGVAVDRLARPGMRVGNVWFALAAPVVAMWLLAASALAQALPEARDGLIFGRTWHSCPFNIGMLSIPLFAATLWAVKGLAPTRLALAGAGAGLLSGALAALVYALHCPESAAPFLAIWYMLGISLPTAAGALLGPRVLRW